MNRTFKKIILYISAIILFLPTINNAQITDEQYKNLYNSKEYSKSLENINTRFNEIYRARVEEKRIPEQMTSIINVGEKTDLVQLFRNRKEKGFLIEDNPEMAEMHLYAGRCYSALNKKMDALNHYIQSLRYSKFEDQKDDAVFYEISQVFRTMEGGIYFKGYTDSLEQAYIFNKNNYNYSLELGMALFSTSEKKKSAYHIERYVAMSGEKPDAAVYLKLASLYESTKRFLDSEKNYNEYLREKPDDGAAHFSLGYISYNHTGNYILAASSFEAALRLLKDDDIFRRSKSYEFLADMEYSNLDYTKSIELYQNAIKYQELIQRKIENKKSELTELNKKITIMKSDVIYKQDFNNFEEYEMLQDEKGKIESEIDVLKYQFSVLNPGKIRWNIAEIYSRIGKYDDAIKYYRESIHFNYNANNSRDLITKLQLKIRRGY